MTIAALGFPMNIRDLLRTHPDLFESKVKEVYWMNGFYNFGCAQGFFLGSTEDCDGAAEEVQDKIPHTIKQYFQLNGEDVCIGDDFYWHKCGETNNPVAAAYRNWMAKSRDICWPARPSWDPLTVFAAIVGAEGAGMSA